MSDTSLLRFKAATARRLMQVGEKKPTGHVHEAYADCVGVKFRGLLVLWGFGSALWLT